VLYGAPTMADPQLRTSCHSSGTGESNVRIDQPTSRQNRRRSRAWRKRTIDTFVTQQLNSPVAKPGKPVRDTAVDAAIALLAERWPACFSVFEQRRRPMKLDIHRDILAALDGAVTPVELGRAMRFYVGNLWYLRMMAAGVAPIDLDGNPSGAVSAEEADGAAARLASRKRNRRPVSTPVPAPPPPKRIGLADLKREAQARKARDCLTGGESRMFGSSMGKMTVEQRGTGRIVCEDGLGKRTTSSALSIAGSLLGSRA
jgi:ProP effector